MHCDIENGVNYICTIRLPSNTAVYKKTVFCEDKTAFVNVYQST